ncbi:MAG: NAD(P)-binding domain-containing protein [Cyanobacteria bacterium J06629_18]
MAIKKVCVIGAGVSGLVAAKTFLEDGFDVTVFEKKPGLGGVWEESMVYPDVKTQNSRHTYCFTDYPMPEDYPEWPNGEQVRRYLQSYADNFGVSERIYFQTEVSNISRRNSVWIVSTKTNDGHEIKSEQHEFDFVLVCNGLLHNPKIPSFPGKEEFVKAGGKVLHSSECNSPALIEDKKVVVVGFGKSACDIATFAANTAEDSTLLFRRAFWKVPKFFFNKIHFEDILLTRFSEIWLPYRKQKGVEKLLHSLGKPLVWTFWRLNELILRKQFNLDACKMMPTDLMNVSLGCNANLEVDNFYKSVYSGKIKAKKGSIAKYIPGGLELDSGEKLQADVVIFGTGFRQEIPFLEEKYRRLVKDEQGSFHLYRNLINPDVPNIGFIGYGLSFFCQLTSEIGSWWLAEYAKGNLDLPTASQINAEINEHLKWDKINLPPAIAPGTCVTRFSFHYLEDLIEDMGFKIFGKGAKPLQGIMERVKPSAYQQIRQQLRSKKPLSTEDTFVKEVVEVR